LSTRRLRWSSARPQSNRAALSGELDEAFHAPELVEPETLNAPRRLERHGTISTIQGDLAVSDFDQLRLIRYPHAALRDRVWALRDNLSA
jgi:predicted nucleic acid-binding protein